MGLRGNPLGLEKYEIYRTLILSSTKLFGSRFELFDAFWTFLLETTNLSIEMAPSSSGARTDQNFSWVFECYPRLYASCLPRRALNILEMIVDKPKRTKPRKSSKSWIYVANSYAYPFLFWVSLINQNEYICSSP